MKSVRKLKKLNQVDVAKAGKISQSAYSKIENGDLELGLMSALLIAIQLEINWNHVVFSETVGGFMFYNFKQMNRGLLVEWLQGTKEGLKYYEENKEAITAFSDL